MTAQYTWEHLLIYGFYPAWMLAGLGDYLAHRFTHIETTSGANEASLHILEFVVMAVWLTLCVMLQMTLAMLLGSILLVALHTVLTYIDVNYTIGRRHISAFEQLVHGVMTILPIAALCVLAVMNLTLLRSDQQTFMRADEDELQRLWLPVSYVLLAGPLALEEWWRARRPMQVNHASRLPSR
jgi:hypothetical protein